MKINMEATPMADFRIQNEGSIVILYPHGYAAEEWINSNLPEDSQRWGTGIVIEPRYLADILAGMENDGLEVE